VILARLADAEAELAAISGLRGGRLRMASFPTAGATIAPQAIARFRELHPDVDISMIPAEPPEGIEKLRTGEIDLALLIDTPWETNPADGVDRVHLLDDPMFVCLPRAHPHASKTRLRLEDLADEAWLLGTGTSCPDVAILLRACAGAGFEPRIGFNSDDYLAIQGFVAAGMGIALIPDLALVTVRDDVIIREMGPRPTIRRITAATLAGAYLSPATEAMLEILVSVGGEFQTGRQELALAV
jgi:DNA-binding transcriptional LysR family regulator